MLLDADSEPRRLLVAGAFERPVARVFAAAMTAEDSPDADLRNTAGLTFDMSGGPKGAKRPLERPLDGRVRPRFGRDEAEGGNCEHDRPSIAAARHLRLGFGVGPQQE